MSNDQGKKVALAACSLLLLSGVVNADSPSNMDMLSYESLGSGQEIRDNMQATGDGAVQIQNKSVADNSCGESSCGQASSKKPQKSPSQGTCGEGSCGQSPAKQPQKGPANGTCGQGSCGQSDSSDDDN